MNLAGYRELRWAAAERQRYGDIKNGLHAKGRPIPENDTWIGAAMMPHDLTVATRGPAPA